MSNSAIIEELEVGLLKKDIPEFQIGDTISVHQRIIEGDKERKQVFTGTVIARKGRGASETVSIHRVAHSEGMERVFLINSPLIAKIEVMRKGDVRRSKLYYLRGAKGKAAKVKMREMTKQKPRPKKAQKPEINKTNEESSNTVE